MPEPFQNRTLQRVPVASVNAGDSIIDNGAGTDLYVHVVQLAAIASAAGTIQWISSPGGALSGAMSVAANGGLVVIGDGVTPIVSTAIAGRSVVLTWVPTTTGNLGGWLLYFVSPVR